MREYELIPGSAERIMPTFEVIKAHRRNVTQHVHEKERLIRIEAPPAVANRGDLNEPNTPEQTTE